MAYRTRLRPCFPRYRDLVAFGVAVGFVIFVAWVLSAKGGADLREAYLPAGRSHLNQFYNPYWVRPLFELLTLLSFRQAYLVVMGMDAIIYVATLCLLDVPWVYPLITYQFYYTLFYGQIDPLVTLGLALEWRAARQHRAGWFGLGMVFALLKPQVSLAATVFLWWRLGDWRRRAQSLLPLLGATSLSILRYGWWFDDIVTRLVTSPPNRWGSISLWEWIGPYALLLWIPVLMASLNELEKLRLILATTALAMPYFQQNSLISLQAFLGPWAWLGNVSFVYYFKPALGWKIGVVLPMGIYLRYGLQVAARSFNRGASP